MKIAEYMHVGSGDAMVKYVHENLAPQLERGALVMFSASTEACNLDNAHAARVSMISVPIGEDSIADGIRQYCDTKNISAIIKRTPTTDRVFWVNDKGGMPLCFFSQLEKMREDYNKLHDTHKGYQLFMGDAKALNAMGLHDEMKQNWADILPDPIVTRDVKETGDKSEQLKKAENIGVLKIDYIFPTDGNQNPVAKVAERKLRKVAGVAVSEASIKRAIGVIPDVEAEKALPAMQSNLPALNEAIAKLTEKRAELVALRDTRDEVALPISHPEQKAKAWGHILGNFNQLVPLNASMSEEQDKSIREAWTTTYARAIREALSFRPNLLAELRIHGMCVEMIDKAIEKIDADIKALNEIINNMPTVGDPSESAKYVARLLMYKLVEIWPAQIVAHLEDDIDKPIFTKQTEMPAIEDLYPEYRKFPMVVRFAAWFGSEGKNGVIGKSLIGMSNEKSNKISSARKPTEQIIGYYQMAKELASDLKDASRKVKNAYYDGEFDDAHNSFAEKIMKKMLDELNDFIDTWGDMIE